MGKRYYWLKLPEDFFRQKPIKKLRKIAGGDTYTIIYLKMLLIAMKEDGKLYFEGVEDDFYEELEETMIMGDMGVRATEEIIEELKQKVKENKVKDPQACRQLLIDTCLLYTSPSPRD